MYCMSCGTELPEHAKFCLECGRPTRPGTPTEREGPRWEYCEIVWSKIRSVPATLQFWASAIGPKGLYSAGASPEWSLFFGEPYPRRDRNSDRRAHEELIEMLLDDGWEPTGEKGEYWYEDRFRRRIPPQTGQP